MGRRKIDIEFITDDLKRRHTFNKRKKCVFKKASELSVLCGVRSCVIIDSPDKQQYEVWPSEREVMNVVQEFSTMQAQQSKRNLAKSTSPEEMLHKQVTKACKQVMELEKKIHEKQLAILMHAYMIDRRCTSEIGSEEANGLLRIAEKRLKKVQERINALSSNAVNVKHAPAPIPAQEILAIAEQSKEEKTEDAQEAPLML